MLQFIVTFMKTNHSKLNYKKCISASIVITLIFVMILALLYGIIYSANLTKFNLIFIYSWLSAFIISLLGYWIYQIVIYERNKKDEER